VNITNWWAFVLLGLAAYRIFRLLAEDSILDGPRAKVLGLPRTWHEGQPIPKNYRSKLADFLICGWCAGFHICLVWWVAWLVWPHGTLVAAVPFALSTIVGSVTHALSDE
jgi:hypothetical protein